jgi:hypothetical protein
MFSRSTKGDKREKGEKKTFEEIMPEELSKCADKHKYTGLMSIRALSRENRNCHIILKLLKIRQIRKY